MDYQRTVDTWRWNLPDQYNIALDCADKHARGRRKNKVALYWENARGDQERLTFLDVSLRSNRFGNGLMALGVLKGDRLLIRLGNVPEFPIVFLAAIKIGALPVPTSIMLSSRELETRVRDTSAVAIVVGADCIDEVEAIWDGCPSLQTVIVVGGEAQTVPMARGLLVNYDSLMEKAASSLSVEDTSPDDEAFIAYSSCTTGDLKAVVHAHRWVIGNDPTALFWQAYRDDDVVACTGPLSWIFPLGNAFLYAWRHGTSVLLYNGDFDPERWFQLLQEYKVSNLAATPTAYRHLLAIDGAEHHYDLSALRHCTSCGEPLNARVVRQWKRRFGLSVLDGLGMTECMTYLSNLVGSRVKAGSCGRPQPGHECALIDPQRGEPVASSQEGVLALRRGDPGLFARYWSYPQTAEQPFVDDWFLTGDVVYRDDEGYYWFLGRADDLINIGGLRVSPFEVESAIIEHPGVLEAAAVPAYDPIRGTTVKCFVAIKPGYLPSPWLAQSIIEATSSRLDKDKQPREIEFVPKLPKTHSGKIKRRMLRELERSGSHSAVSGAAQDTYPDFLVSLTDIGAE